MLEKLESRNRLQSRRMTESKRLNYQPTVSNTLMTRLDQPRGSDFSSENGIQTSNANFFVSKAQDLEEQMKIQFPSLYVMYVCQIFCLPLDYLIFDLIVSEIHINSGWTTVRIPDPDLKWSTVFNYIEKNRVTLGVKSFFMEKSTIDNILDDLTKSKTI